jgi:hypothetical protein
MKKHQLTLLTLLFSYCIYSQQWPGYTLYSVMNSTSTTLLDTNSGTFHSWTHSSSATSGYTPYLLPGGYLLRPVKKSGTSFTGGPICGEVQKVDWNGNIVWDFVYSTTNYCSHHDICPLPNGNVLLVCYERKTSAEVTAAGCSTFSSEMWPEKIVEIQPVGSTTGNVVWEWHVWDHLQQSTNASAANYQSSISAHPELMNINYLPAKDWLHVNGIHYNPILDQITFSSRTMNEIYVIDHSTTTAEAASHSGGNGGKGGDLLFRWGNPAAWSSTGTTIGNIFHDAHWIPENPQGMPHEGRLVAFNNKGVSSLQSTVEQIDPPISGYNYTFGTPATYTARHQCSGYTSNDGSSQQFPNGNMMVTMSLSGLIYEIDSSGTTLWSKTVSGSIPMTHRYDSCYIANAAPAIPTISESAGVLNSSSATTYQWYLNGVRISGETNQSYTPTQDGIYLVRITDAVGCMYQYSTSYKFTMTTGIKAMANEYSLQVFPNPTDGILNLQSEMFNQTPFVVNIYDLNGKLCLSNANSTVIDVSGLTNGFYTLSILVENQRCINKKISVNK